MCRSPPPPLPPTQWQQFHGWRSSSEAFCPPKQIPWRRPCIYMTYSAMLYYFYPGCCQVATQSEGGTHRHFKEKSFLPGTHLKDNCGQNALSRGICTACGFEPTTILLASWQNEPLHHSAPMAILPKSPRLEVRTISKHISKMVMSVFLFKFFFSFYFFPIRRPSGWRFCREEPQALFRVNPDKPIQDFLPQVYEERGIEADECRLRLVKNEEEDIDYGKSINFYGVNELVLVDLRRES